MKFFSSFSKYNKPFLNHDLDPLDYLHYPKTFNTVQQLKPLFEQLITKPQQLIADHDDYYVARDILTNTLYICFKNMLMVDIDTYKLDFDHKDVLKLLNESEYLFHVYQSANGYHAFCVSHYFDYDAKDTFDVLLKLNCDFFYAFYAHLRGFCVRLNRKLNEYMQYMACKKTKNVPLIYKYIGTFGQGCEIKALKDLVDLHIQYVQEYNNHTPIA